MTYTSYRFISDLNKEVIQHLIHTLTWYQSMQTLGLFVLKHLHHREIKRWKWPKFWYCNDEEIVEWYKSGILHHIARIKDTRESWGSSWIETIFLIYTILCVGKLNWLIWDSQRCMYMNARTRTRSIQHIILHIDCYHDSLRQN